MTEETRKLIEPVKRFDPHQIAEYSHIRAMHGNKMKLFIPESDFIRVVAELTKWYDAKDDKPTTDQETEGIFYSDYVLMRLKGYQHPFVGYYVKADGVEFFDFIQPSFQDGLEQSDITEWRYIY